MTLQQMVPSIVTVSFTLQLLFNTPHGAFINGHVVGQESHLNKDGKHLESGQKYTNFRPHFTAKNVSIPRDDLAQKEKKKIAKDLFRSGNLETDLQSSMKLFNKFKFIGKHQLKPNNPLDADSLNKRHPAIHKRIVRNVPLFQNDDMLSVVDSAYSKRAFQQKLRRKTNPKRRTFVGTFTGVPKIVVGLGLTSLFGGSIWAGRKLFSPWFVGPPGPPGPPAPITLESLQALLPLGTIGQTWVCYMNC